MNNKIVLSLIIFCYSNTLMSMDPRKPHHQTQAQSWYQSKEINVAEKITGVVITEEQREDITRKDDGFYITSISFDQSEQLLGIASCDKKVHIMDVKSEQILMSREFQQEITAVCFNYPERTNEKLKFAVLLYKSKIKKPKTYCFDIQHYDEYDTQHNTYRTVVDYDSFDSIEHSKELSSIFFDNNNKIHGVILDENSKTMTVINIIQNTQTPFEHNEWIKLGAVSQSKKYFVTGSDTGQARLFNLQTRQPICKFQLRGSISALAFDRAEQLLAIASNEHKVHIFDLKTFDENTKAFREIVSIPHKKFVSTVCFSSSGKSLATGSFDGKVRIFKTK